MVPSTTAIPPVATAIPPERPEFPSGMRVLVIDDDPTYLKIIEGLLLKCHYTVRGVSQAIEALEVLKDKNEFDIVLADVHMPDMDGFKLVEILVMEMNIPIILMSVDEDAMLVKKSIYYGACDYLLKPIALVQLKIIWQHVIRKKVLAVQSEVKSSTSKLDNSRKEHELEEVDSTHKRPRVAWTKALQEKFVAVVNKLGGEEKAVPKKILDAMQEPSLTRENVSSHLQKYRNALKKSKRQASDSYHNPAEQARRLANTRSPPSFEGRQYPAEGSVSYTAVGCGPSNQYVYRTAHYGLSHVYGNYDKENVANTNQVPYFATSFHMPMLPDPGLVQSQELPPAIHHPALVVDNTFCGMQFNYEMSSDDMKLADSLVMDYLGDFTVEDNTLPTSLTGLDALDD